MDQHSTEELQAQVLQLVRHAARPLRLIEIADAISTSNLLGWGGDLNGCKEAIRGVCTPPLELTSSETLKITHVEDGNKGAAPASEEESKRMAMFCISYLTSGPLGPLDRMRLTRKNWKGHDFGPAFNSREELKLPFTDYALENWLNHVKKSRSSFTDSSELSKALDGLMEGDRAAKLVHTQGLDSIDEFRKGKWPTNGLILAVVLGLVDYVRVLLDRDESDTSWPIGLVTHAAKNGDEAMVNLLLDRGADVQEVNIHGQTPLHEAVRKGHRDVVVCLLNRGANILAPSGKDKTMTDFDSGLDPVLPLALACNGSHLETLSALLEHVKSEDTANWALRWAVEGGNTDAVKRVLQLPMVNVNAMGKRHWDMTTSLSSACSRRDLPVIEVLLAAGGDPRILHHHPPSLGQRFAGAMPPRADTALHQLSQWTGNHGVRMADTISTATRNRMTQCFRRLLNSGADVHQRNDEDATPLLVAADSIAVEELLRAGSDVNARDFWGATILHRTDSAAVALAVLDVAGGMVDLKAGSAHGRSVLSPLLGWIKKGSVKVVLRLLELGASAAVKDSNGDGVFHYLAQQTSMWPDSEPLISAFLSSGADINSTNSAGLTILQLLAGGKAPQSWQSTTKGHDTVLRAVLKAGANVEIRDVDGRTPLFHLAEASRLDAKSVERISKTLIDAGADLDTRDKEGRSLLHAAAGTLNVDLLEFLLHSGARADAVDASGNTIWHEAVTACKSAHPTETNMKCLGKMATIGADPKRSNHAGRTPLHILSAMSPTRGEDAAKKAVAKVSRFDILLSLYDGILDVTDERGVTPIHLASEGCEHHLQRLLDHGADPTRVTGEGLSALHIAARARRENISALLIQHLKARYDNDDKSLSAFVNLRDGKGKSALWYACSGGQEGIARRLFDAGATTLSEDPDESCWEACTHYEATLDKATAGRKSTKSWDVPDFAPALPPLQGVVNLLATVADKTHLTYAIHKAHNNGCDYVVECLAEVDRQYADIESVQKSAQRRREFLAKSGRKTDSRLKHLWSNNDISGIESLLQEEDLLNMGSSGTPETSSVVHRLASERLVALLRGVLTRDLIIQMEDRFEETKRISKFKRTWYCEHLLTTALKSEEPNMGMVELLLDSLGDPKMEWGQTSENDETLSYSDRQNWPSDVLFLLIQAGHWWQIHEALPYLIKHGADLNVRQKHYLLTPLQVAIDINTESCDNHVTSAVRLLLDMGADPNVVAGWHQYLDSTALSLARDNVELVKLLIDRGAVPTTEDVRRVIEDGHEGALNIMLQHGADPNLRTPKNTVRAPNSYKEDLANLFPLHIAYKKAFGSVDNREKYLSIVDLLLKHGANPLARYDEKNTSMIHLLVQDGIYPSRLLDNPGLDMEYRDGSGATVFLAACKSPPPRRLPQQAGPGPDAERDLVAMILEHGVNIRVRDNMGRNALHFLQHKPESTRRIAEETPDLVNQQDNEGNTPIFLHITSRNVAQINALLENGADVTLANNLGETPLHRIFGSSWHLNEDNSVMQDEHREITMSLIKHGADVNARNVKNETPLFYFFRNGEVINYSDQHWKGRDIEPKTDEKKEHEDEETQLSQHLADLGVDFLPGSNSDGETLLHVVASGRYRGISSPEWFKLLLDKGHDLKEENKTHETPFDVAVRTRNRHLLELV